MRKVLTNKLEVFLHHNIRWILRVSITKLHEDHIKNEHMQCMFYDIPHVSNMIVARQLDFIGKTIHGPFDRTTQQLLTACCDHTRQVGHPFLYSKDFVGKNLSLLFVNVPEVTINDR